MGRAVPAAALSLIRLDELEQAHNPLSRKLLNVLLVGQELDGGWGDPLTTALCLRALLCGHGQGQAVQRALTYVATMQKAEGIWPKEPLRRMPGRRVHVGVHPDAAWRPPSVPRRRATVGCGRLVHPQRRDSRPRYGQALGQGQPALPRRTVDAAHLAVWS